MFHAFPSQNSAKAHTSFSPDDVMERAETKLSEFYDHRTNIWIRHELLAATLSSKPKYGANRSSEASLAQARDSIGKFHGDESFNVMNGSSSSDKSHSARWGWVKAFLMHDHTSLSGGHDNFGFTSNSKGRSADTRSITIQVVDRESEFMGLSVQIPRSLIRQFDQNMDNRNRDSLHYDEDNTVFGGVILMANSWADFTTVPVYHSKDDSRSTHAKASSSRFANSTQGKPTQQSKNDEEDGVLIKPPSDLTTLTNLHEPEVVFSLRHRYAANEIYTSSGPILLALNPFKDIKHVYGEDQMRRYWEQGESVYSGTKTDASQKLDPHVYGTADDAFRSMMRALEDVRTVGTFTAEMAMLKDQSILVSGESGAGKTVTTKIIMKYLATLSKRSTNSSRPKPARNNNASGFKGIDYSKQNESDGNSSQIEQQVLESNPILESFGNARTLRNDNSSRFGKFIEMKFTSHGRLIGAGIDSYLLEKVRLVKQSDGERNYHIFYELLSGANSNERKKLLIGSMKPEDFKMTFSASSTYKRRDGVKDDVSFAALRKAMSTMGFDSNEQWSIFEVVCAVLHLSNVTFKGSRHDHCALDTSNSSLPMALALLGVSQNALNSALCSLQIEVGGEKVSRSFGVSQAVKGLEALMKATYGALFSYLVARVNNCIDETRQRVINESVAADDSKSSSFMRTMNDTAAFIGILDIFGFETFGKNSFEQLCINYCNESLQQQFNRFVFKLEQAEYEREEISWKFIKFPDNQHILDLIDNKRNGILAVLDENSFLAQCTDQSFAQSLYKHCAVSKSDDDVSALTAKSSQKAQGLFTINHYAGPVEYDCLGFIEKNKDELPKETLELLLGSSNHFVQHLATIINTAPSGNVLLDGQSGRAVHHYKQNSLKKVSVGAQFSHQLQLLRERIDATVPHYIRCLKPNDRLQPDNFESAVIADQLRCAGILEAVRVSRVGYPQRYPHSRFIHRYKVLAGDDLRQAHHANKTFDRKQTNKNPAISSSNIERECKLLVGVLSEKLLSLQSRDSESANARTAKKSQKKETISKDSGIQMGLTKVFLRQHAFDALERMRGQIKARAAIVIVSFMRMCLERNRYVAMRQDYRSMITRRNDLFMKLNHDEVPPANWEKSASDSAVLAWLQRIKEDAAHVEDDTIPYELRNFKWKRIDTRWVRQEFDDDGNLIATIECAPPSHFAIEPKKEKDSFHWSLMSNTVSQSPWIRRDKEPDPTPASHRSSSSKVVDKARYHPTVPDPVERKNGSVRASNQDRYFNNDSHRDLTQGYAGPKQVNGSIGNVSAAAKKLSTTNLRKIVTNNDTHNRSAKNLVVPKSPSQSNTRRTMLDNERADFNNSSRSKVNLGNAGIRRVGSDLEESGIRRAHSDLAEAENMRMLPHSHSDSDKALLEKKNMLNQISNLQLRSTGSWGASSSDKKIPVRNENSINRSRNHAVNDSASTANTMKTSNAAVSNKQNMLMELTSRHQLRAGNDDSARSQANKAVAHRETIPGKNAKTTSFAPTSADRAMSDRRNMLNELSSRQQSRSTDSSSSMNRKVEMSNRYDSNVNSSGKMQGSYTNNRVERTDSRKSPQTGFDAFSPQSFQNESFGDFPSFDMEAVKKGSKKEENRKGEQKRGFFSLLSRDSKQKKSSKRPNGEDSDTFNSSSLSDHMFNDDKFDYFNVGH